MASIDIHLFGKFSIACNDQILECLKSQKAQELFCYLILFRDRIHYRESLADLLWRDQGKSQARKYLRKTIWQLQNELERIPQMEENSMIQIDANWIQFTTASKISIDVIVLENAFKFVKGVRGFDFDNQHVQTIKDAMRCYYGDLLEGCYADWCIYERERLKEIYLMLIGKLLNYCQANYMNDDSLIDEGILLSHKILSYEPTHERTHASLMLFHYLLGDRTTALHQYEHCKTILKEELDVEPSNRTFLLYQQIKNDDLYDQSYNNGSKINDEKSSVAKRFSRIKSLLETQKAIYLQLPREIQELEDDISGLVNNRK